MRLLNSDFGSAQAKTIRRACPMPFGRAGLAAAILAMLAAGLAGAQDASYVVINGNTGSGLVKVASDGSVTTIAAAQRGNDVVVAKNGDLIVAAISRLVRVTPVGVDSTIASAGSGSQWLSVAQDAAGNFIVGDNWADRIWRVSADGSSVVVVASVPAASNELEDIRIVVDGAGNYIVAIDNGSTGHLYSVTPDGVVTPIPLTGPVLPRGTSGLALDASGNYMVMDYIQRSVFRITPAGVVTVFAHDDSALCCSAVGLARNPATGEYVTALNFGHTVKKISADGGTITTLASGPLLPFPESVAVIPPPATPVTIASVPSGRAFTVSGAGCQSGGYAAPQTLTWDAGASCNVNFVSPQGGTPGVRYAFANWSDDPGAGASRSISTPVAAATYTASFTTQYLLTASVNPAGGGTISPATDYVNAGTTVVVSAAANSTYVFTGFTGALGGTGTPQNLTVNGPLSVTANFALGPDLTISKAHVTTVFSQAQAGAQYALTVKNMGLGAATGTIQVSDTLPAALTFVSGSGGGFSCSAVGQVVTCASAGPMAPAGIAVITLTVNVAALAPASLTNSAAVACTCLETNSGNNTSNADVVTVQPTAQGIGAQVQVLLGAGVLSPSQASGLTDKLNAIIASLDRGQTGAACDQLSAFINQVSAFIYSGALTPAQGQALINAANGVKAVIGCA